MNTKQEVMAILDEFVTEYQGKHSIYAISVGPGATEYDAYGKCRRDNKSDCIDYALHIFTNISTETVDTIDIPIMYRGVRTMIFFQRE